MKEFDFSTHNQDLGKGDEISKKLEGMNVADSDSNDTPAHEVLQQPQDGFFDSFSNSTQADRRDGSDMVSNM
jgi:hypothetical protein